MKKFKSQKGVTLVALVITIIVLIILAGISINLVLGNNGIITIAKKAKENIELAKIEEEIELNELYTQLESSGTTSGGTNYDAIAKLTEFKTAIANAIDEAGGIRPDTTAETAIFADNIKGILKEVTKDATATANDIAKGKTAWVNGELITGTKTSNITYTSEWLRLSCWPHSTGAIPSWFDINVTNNNTLILEITHHEQFHLYFDGKEQSSTAGTNQYDISNVNVVRFFVGDYQGFTDIKYTLK